MSLQRWNAKNDETDHDISVEFFSFNSKHETIQLVVHVPQADKIYYKSQSKEFVQALKNVKEIK